MTKKSDNYEKFIKYLIENVKSTRTIKVLGHGKRFTLKGASGQLHQIDVAFIDYSFCKPTLVFVECKWRKKKTKYKIDTSVPKIIKYNMDDIVKTVKYSKYRKNNIMIIVSTSLFQPGAVRIAKYEEIRTQTVNDSIPFGFDYENLIQMATKDDVKINDIVEVKIVPKAEKGL